MTLAEMLAGFVLLFAVPAGDGTWRPGVAGFASRERCLIEAPAILSRPINAGALVISDCAPGRYDPSFSICPRLSGANRESDTAGSCRETGV